MKAVCLYVRALSLTPIPKQNVSTLFACEFLPVGLPGTVPWVKAGLGRGREGESLKVLKLWT